MTPDELEWWLEQPPPPEQRTFHPGCLVVVAVCVIIWLAAILGAVQLYKRSPLDPVITTPPAETTHPPLPTHPTPLTISTPGVGTAPTVAPEDLDR
jgi:hypothetical protein